MTSPNFVPKNRVVTNVTNALQCVVTSSTHGFEVDQTVRLKVPSSYGMNLNEVGRVLTSNDDDFTLNIDTSFQDPFVEPTFTSGTQTGFTYAQATPDSGEWLNDA